MGLNKYKLGELIELSDERNYSGKYSLDSVKGISTEKTFIDTKANMDGVSLDTYKVVNPGEFSYVPDTSRRGDKIALAFNNSNVAILISSIYTTFKCRRKDLLIPEFLFIFFNRPEFDRYSRFNSWGSARETFSWEDFCDIDITLPSVEQQRKYVDVYLSLQKNLEAYQSKVDELKLVCDGYLDKLKAESGRLKIGELLEEVDNRNNGSKIQSVKGINIEKSFMDSVADTNGVDLSKYKVVNENEFAFSGMQTGRDECIRIALNESKNPIIVSPAYTVLKVKNDSVLVPYIQLWFSRKEIDRYGWFASDGSIRSNLDLERFFDMQIPIPSIETQRSIASIYKVYKERKAIASQLKEQLNNLCPILIKGSLQN
mgnify:CR=1 FL=1